MTPEEFKLLWESRPDDDRLVQFSQTVLDELNLRPDTIQFLLLAGLPNSAAPFLSFVQKEDGGYNSICRVRELYDFLEDEFDKYVIIGSDCYGNPIVINTDDNDKIEWLDHDDLFSPHFFNSSIIGLAGCLLAQREFVKRVIAENGEDAILNANFTDDQFTFYKYAINKADSICLECDGFWEESTQIDLANRAAYLANL